MNKISNLKSNQSGFTTMQIIVIVVLVAVLSFVAFRILITAQNNANATESSETEEDLSDSKQTFLVLGITLELPGSLKEQLEFVEASADGNVTAKLSSRDVSLADPNCNLGESDAPLGVLFRIEGQYPSEANATNTPGVLAKQTQLTDFYIAYRAPQQECTSNQELNGIISDYKQQLLDSFSTIEQLN